MAGPTVNLSLIPTGGAVLLQMPEYFSPPSGVTTMALSRMVSGASTWTQLYSGGLLPVYIDTGDKLPAPLSPTTTYMWRVGDERGETVTDSLMPASTMVTQPDQLTELFTRLLQGGINCLPAQPGMTAIKPLQITTQMPVNGYQAMPFIVVNLDLIQQSEVEIGEDVQNPDADNTWTLWVNAKRVWRVSVLSTSADERDFYRDFLLSIFRVLKATAFAPLGLNVEHSFQAASYTDANEWEGKAPGFYGCDLMFELDGTFPTAVLFGYGTILHITAVVETTGGSVIADVSTDSRT